MIDALNFRRPAYVPWECRLTRQCAEKLKAYLGGQDYALVTARSADEALAAAKTARPDLVIADAVLGTGNGYDLCAAFRADSALRAVPVHILVSSQNPLDEAAGGGESEPGEGLEPSRSRLQGRALPG